MLKYLIIPLADDAVSFCHYSRKTSSSKLIPLETLRKAIVWGMKENLTIQFLFPDRLLPEEYIEEINSIDHATIVPSQCEDECLVRDADIVVFDSWPYLLQCQYNDRTSYVVRSRMSDFINNVQTLKNALSKADRIVVIITDIDTFPEQTTKQYKDTLEDLIPVILKEYGKGHVAQLNLLTDRLYLNDMNNCNAGFESITLAPDGRFYICPAFYASGWESEGDLQSGLSIRNSQLFRIDHAPICRECDAYQCRRCVWLNRIRTLEVNTPGHIQCLVSHIERNASRTLMSELRKKGTFLPGVEIPEIDYMDPFEKVTR